MASRVSRTSSISSISGIERPNADFQSLRHTPTATISTQPTEQPRSEQRPAVNQVNEAVAAEPLLSPRPTSRPGEYTIEYEAKGPIQTHQMHYDTRSWYHDWWFWEIAGALLSLGSTVAIVVMLAVCNNRPLPVLRYGITLNAMLSVLSTIAKTSMLLAATESIGQAKWLLFRKQSRNLVDFNTIDEASRGPWGAFQLLYRFWDGRTILASAGAFIVLTSLAVDPFTQQILSYPSISNVTSGYPQPSLPRVSTWNTTGSLTVWESGNSDPTSALPLALRAAIYNSLLGLGSASSTLDINCPTGNCTFDLSDTLGFCSTCSDVTPQVTKNCKPIPTTQTTGGTNCTYTLPSKVNLHAVDEEIPDDYQSSVAFSRDFRRTTNMSVVAMQRYQTLWSNDRNVVTSFEDPDHTTPTPNKTVFQGVADPLLGFGRILFNTSNDPMSIIGNDVMPTATECALYWCVQTLNTTIQNGILNQTIVGTWSNSSALDTSDVHLSPSKAGSNSGAKHATDEYYVSPMSNVPLARFLQNTFNATVQGINLPDTQFSEAELLDLTIYSSDIAQALWHADDLASLMNNLADRMTDALRNLYSDPAAAAAAEDLGNVYTNQTYVHVTWAWLILPVGLVLACCIVLFAAIISSSSSRHGGTIVWKSSSLAVLFHGLARRGEGEGVGESVHRRSMERAAEGMKVLLTECPNGDLRLVEVERRRGVEARKSRVGWRGRWLGRGMHGS